MRLPLPRLGLRREVVILLPTALLLLVAVAAFTLFAWRDGLARLGEERRTEGERQARRLAGQLERLWPTAEAGLAPLATGLAGLAVVSSDGRSLATWGLPLPAPAAPWPPAGPRASGPAPGGAGLVVAEAPFSHAGRRLFVRLALPAEGLAAERRALAVWAPVAAALGLAVVLLVLLFLRPLLAPYDTLVRRARDAGLLEASDADEIRALVAGFERALARDAEPAPGPAAAGEALGQELAAGLLLLDATGRVVALNPAGANLLGVKPAPGGELAALLAPHPALAAELAAAVATGRSIERAEVAVDRPGGAITLGLALHPLRRPDGGRRGFLALFSDLTRFSRIAAEQRLAESLAQLGELAAGVAHELRNGLATLGGWLDLLATERDPAAAAECRAELGRETVHLQRVVDDFLAFARPGRAGPEPISLGELLAAAAADPTVQDVGARLALPAAPVPVLSGDPQLLGRAVRDLVRNAAEAERAAGGRGPIEIGLAPGGGGAWEIRISDRGPGLPPAVRARLFQPFVSGRPGGTGLGLALARRLVDLHGGTLRLDDRPGGGTSAVISFPAGAFVT